MKSRAHSKKKQFRIPLPHGWREWAILLVLFGFCMDRWGIETPPVKQLLEKVLPTAMFRVVVTDRIEKRVQARSQGQTGFWLFDLFSSPLRAPEKTGFQAARAALAAANPKTDVGGHPVPNTNSGSSSSGSDGSSGSGSSSGGSGGTGSGGRGGQANASSKVGPSGSVSGSGGATSAGSSGARSSGAGDSPVIPIKSQADFIKESQAQATQFESQVKLNLQLPDSCLWTNTTAPMSGVSGVSDVQVLTGSCPQQTCPETFRILSFVKNPLDLVADKDFLAEFGEGSSGYTLDPSCWEPYSDPSLTAPAGLTSPTVYVSNECSGRQLAIFFAKNTASNRVYYVVGDCPQSTALPVSYLENLFETAKGLP